MLGCGTAWAAVAVATQLQWGGEHWFRVHHACICLASTPTSVQRSVPTMAHPA